MGEHVYENVLYTGDDMVSKLLTGGSFSKSKTSIDDIIKKSKKKTREGEPPQIAKSNDTQYKSEKPYVYRTFFHSSVTKEDKEYQTAFHRVWYSKSYSIKYNANYDTGTLIIEVSKIKN